jgi:hypothetical protein
MNFGSFCLAFLLFLLPWTSVQCGGTVLATQSGFQAITANVNIKTTDDPRSTPGGRNNNAAAGANKGVNDLGSAFLTAIALAVVLAGIALTALSLFKPALLIQNGRPVPVTAWMLAAGALALLLMQAVSFPIDRMINDLNSQAKAGAPTDQMSKDLLAAMTVTTSRSGWFYLELVALAVPVGLYFGAGKIGSLPRTPPMVSAFPVIHPPARPSETDAGPIPLDEPEL